jgi:hypothetical protein
MPSVSMRIVNRMIQIGRRLMVASECYLTAINVP